MVWFLKKIQIKTGKFQQRNQYLEIYRTQYLLSIEVLMHGKKWENLKSEHCIYSCRICNVTQQEQTLTKKNKTIANYHISIMKGQADDHYFEGGYWNRCWMIRKASPFRGLRNTIQSRK